MELAAKALIAVLEYGLGMQKAPGSISTIFILKDQVAEFCLILWRTAAS